MPSALDKDDQHDGSENNAAKELLARGLHRTDKLLVGGLEREIVQEDEAETDFRAAECWR